ncbi:MAG TPA: hypothetical protein VM686_08885 [Polyangiaceae bacterium]|jgi:hypothetical protein|nr:hypothetical protein [Polyangiaceae bacterium]
MQRKAYEPGIEVSGASLAAILDGFKQYPSIAMKHLVKHGVIKNAGATWTEVDKSGWYPLETWLAAHDAIASEVGINALYSIGKSIPKAIPLPPHITDIFMLMGSIDVVYHMNHRKNGKVMFNPETGEMLEGIGHHSAKIDKDNKRIVMESSDPYPCDFNRGIMTAWAARFQEDAKTIHDNNAPCKKKGAESCSYIIWW